MPLLLPDLLLHDRVFRPGLGLDYDADSGRIRAVRAVQAVQDGAAADRLEGVALLPGFVNAHSHAFQRVIRGRTQWRPADAGVADFWSWREAMYQAALSLSPADVYAVSRFCFVEMLLAGITTVGEFHYLHNDEQGRWYEDPAELAHRVIAAAQDAGIRIRLLNVLYATGGVGERLRPEQRRFATVDMDAFLGTTELLASRYGDVPAVSVGVAPHSVRAVPREWLSPLHAWAVRQDMPLHMHAAEQPAEVDACVGAYGRRPIELLADEGLLDARFTAVHATHVTDAEVELLGRSGATVCACPGTERDLGDGILRARDLVRAGARIALGTDSQTILDMLEEIRLIEYHERLARRERVMVTEAGDAGQRLEPAPLLLEMATAAGARSLHLHAGVFETGALADFVAIDLRHPALAGWTAASLPALLAFSAPAGVVRHVWVGGRRVVHDRHHDALEEATVAFERTSRRLRERT